ncbi:MAG: hypothetical protein Q9190_002936 [Brigantiaea leucoxantha]
MPGTVPQPSCRELLLDMVKSLIVQLALLLPERFVTRLDLSSARFQKLHGACGIEDTILLLRDLRSLIPKYFHCIICGLQELEDRNDAQLSRDLLHVVTTLATLHEDKAMSVSREESETVLHDVEENRRVLQTTKLCFTSDGYVDALARLAERGHVDKIEYLDEAHELAVEESVRLMPQ